MNMENTNQYIAAIFKATRKFNRLQQTEFAAILEITQGAISKIESGNMHPELGLWFKLLRSFKISDPYCFTYGGVEFNQDSFSYLKKEGAALLPQFDFSNGKTIFNVRTIRPIFDFLMKNHSKAFVAFLKENKIGIEVFYILNHPLSFDFAECFFFFLKENKINEKSLAHLDLNFASSFSSQAYGLMSSNPAKLFFDVLNNEKETFIKYKLDSSGGAYTVSLSPKHLFLINSLPSKEFILNYNFLYPYHFLKSTKQCVNKSPLITEIKKDLEWRVEYAS